MTSPNMSPYEAGISALAYYHIAGSGCLRVTGADRLDYLQRQTSNDLRRLQPGVAVLTVLTSPTARILDVLYVLAVDESLLALTLAGMAADTARFLKSRIFFMDQVAVEDVSHEYVQIDILGSEASRFVMDLGFEQAPQPDQWVSAQLGSVSVKLLALEPSFALGFRLLAPVADLLALQEILADRGAQALQDHTYQILRIEAGLPAVGHELRQEFTPLEAGLGAAVSDHKGCYTGQEVLSRQITYDKVTQSLCGLQLEGEVAPGERLWTHGKPAGLITSVAHSPRFGWIGLGILKRPYHQTGELLIVGERDAGSNSAKVVSLPFAGD